MQKARNLEGYSPSLKTVTDSDNEVPMFAFRSGLVFRPEVMTISR
jgi:hypothetical protein